MKMKKGYDAVAEVRKIRDKNSLKYWGNDKLLFQDLKAAREEAQERRRKISEQQS